MAEAMSLTGDMVVVCDYLLDLIKLNQSVLGLEAVYYGDQTRIPVTPALCLEPDEKPRALKSAQRMVEVNFTVYLLVYHSPVSNVERTRRECDLLARDVEKLIDTKKSLDGLVIHGFVNNISSGYVDRGGLMRASRLTYEAKSQELLPSTG